MIFFENIHPAWDLFLRQYHPATEHEKPEYLDTSQVLDRLNNMIAFAYSEAELVVLLQNAGFKVLSPAPAGLHLWMLKDTPLKMINGPEQPDAPVLLNNAPAE